MIREMRTLFLCVLLALVFVVVSATDAPADILYFNQDTYVSESTPSTVKNNDRIIVKRHTGNTRHSYVEFTIGSSAVNSALLSMYWYSRPTGWGSWHNVNFYVSDSYTFSESTLTWSNQPDYMKFKDLDPNVLASNGWTFAGTWKAELMPAWQSVDIKDYWNANLGKTVTLFMHVPSGSQSDCGGVYEDTEGIGGTTNYPHISTVPIPEPSSLVALSGLAVPAFALLRRRRS